MRIKKGRKTTMANNYVVQMSKSGSGNFKLMDEEARTLIEAEETARQEAVADVREGLNRNAIQIYSRNLPNYDVTQQELTIYANTLVVDAKNGTQTGTENDIVLSFDSTNSQTINIVLYDTVNKSFTLSAYRTRIESKYAVVGIIQISGVNSWMIGGVMINSLPTPNGTMFGRDAIRIGGRYTPNFNTLTKQLTIPANVLVYDMITNENTFTSEEVVLDWNSQYGQSVNYILYNTQTKQFALERYGNKVAAPNAIVGMIFSQDYKKSWMIGGLKVNGRYTEASEMLLSNKWLSKVEEINTKRKAHFAFLIQTDTHFDITDIADSNLGANVSELTTEVGFDFAANLGDIIRGYADETIDSPENTRKAMTEIMRRYVTGIACPFMVAMGNHERNTMHAAEYQSDPIPFDELYGRMFVPAFNTNRQAVKERGVMYYYTDFDDVRVVVLNTQDGSNGGFGVGQEQIDWFTNTALDIEKKIIVLSHVPLIDGWSVSSNYHPTFANIVNALKAFKTNGGYVVGCFSGHTHTRENQTSDGILFVTYGNGASVAEATIVDLTSKTIETVILGSSNANREFSFE